MRLLKFFRDFRGSALPMFGLMLVPLVTMSLMAVDYSRGVRARDTLQRAADAAVIAATTRDPKVTEAARLAKAKGVFAANLGEGEFVGVVPTITITKNSAVVEARYSVKLMAPSLSGSDTLDVAVVAKGGADPRNRILDLAFCIDGTTSMGGTLAGVKKHALSFAEDLNAEIVKRGEPEFAKIRIRALVFHDFDGVGLGFGDDPPLTQSPFFDMPAQNTGLKQYLDGEELRGGFFDIPESGNECLDAAIQSEWQKNDSDDYFPMIVIWSDADAKVSPRVPNLTAHWNDPSLIPQKNKTIIHFGVCGWARTAPSAVPGWIEAIRLPGFECGGTVYEANSDIVGKLAESIVKRSKRSQWRITQ